MELTFLKTMLKKSEYVVMFSLSSCMFSGVTPNTPFRFYSKYYQKLIKQTANYQSKTYLT